jgi:TatA/E family protein of Tat protein translocase
MLDIGIQELLVIMVLALLVFGPDKLPDLGRRLGRAMREFRRASDEFRSTVEQNLQMNVDHDISPPSPSPSSPFEPAVTSVSDTGSTDASQANQAVGADGQAVAVPAGTTAEASPASGEEESLEPFWTSRGGRLFHRRECAWRARVPAHERIPLKTALEGTDQGLQPCPACDPKELALAS